MQDLIGYDLIIENAMRAVIYETLKKVEKSGLPGKHYFMVTYLTKYPGVEMSQHLLEKYNEEITIAIQYQFRNLIVAEDHFSVSLSFNGNYEKLTVPYAAITSFLDPSINFGLRFTANYEEFEEEVVNEGIDPNNVNKNNNKEKTNSSVDLSAKIISLDAFRKNKDDSDKK